jgi:Leucine-rich repeat (LRR) protein
MVLAPPLLRPLVSLSHLRLDGNQLHRVEAGALQPCAALRSLQLAGNRLRSGGLVAPPAGSLPRLTSLELGRNLLGPAVPWSWLRAAPNLRRLGLQGNRLRAAGPEVGPADTECKN